MLNLTFRSVFRLGVAAIFVALIAVCLVLALLALVGRPSDLRGETLAKVLISNLILGWFFVLALVFSHRLLAGYWARLAVLSTAALLVLILTWLIGARTAPASEHKRLVELGIAEATYKEMSLGTQLSAFVDVARYSHNPPAEVLLWMAVDIGMSDEDAVEPVLWTIRAHIAGAVSGDHASKRIVYWLPEALLVAARRGASLRTPAARSLIATLACGTLEQGFVEGNLSATLLQLAYPDLPEIGSDREAWKSAACSELEPSAGLPVPQDSRVIHLSLTGSLSRRSTWAPAR